MNFKTFLSESKITDADIKRLIGEVDVDAIIKKIKKAASNLNLDIFKSNIYIASNERDVLTGNVVYTLNGPDEKYQSDKYDFPEEDYFYVGTFQYNLASEKVTSFEEGTETRYESPLKASDNIVKVIKAIKL